MNRVMVGLLDIADIKSNNTFLGNGKEGSCYFLNKDTIIKLFHLLKAERKLNFVGYSSDFIAFPKDIYYYYDSNLIEGYTMNYMKGISLSNDLDNDLLIEKLILAYNKIKSEIETLPNIYMADLVRVNVLYDYNANNINIIDTSRWYRLKNSKDKNVNRLNCILIKSLLMTINPLDYEYKSEKLKKLYNEYRGLELELGIYNLDIFLEILEELIKYNKKTKDKVKTIGDLKIKS